MSNMIMSEELQGDNADLQGRTQEYQTLRAELLLHIELQRRSLHHCMLLTAALMGWALTNNNALVCIPAWLVNFYYWALYRKEDDSIYKLGAYIAVFREGQHSESIPGLAWQKRVTKADYIASQRPKRFRLPATIKKLIVPHALVSLTTILIGLSLGLGTVFHGPHRWWLAVIFVAVIVLHSLLVRGALYVSTATTLRGDWHEVFEQVKEEE